MVGQGIEGFFHLGLVGEAADRPLLQAAQEGVAKAVGGEESVQVAALHPAVIGNRATGFRGAAGQR